MYSETYTPHMTTETKEKQNSFILMGPDSIFNYVAPSSHSPFFGTSELCKLGEELEFPGESSE